MRSPARAAVSCMFLSRGFSAGFSAWEGCHRAGGLPSMINRKELRGARGEFEELWRAPGSLGVH
eukprot:14462721-Alexandrium_andersonii.AAC.1